MEFDPETSLGLAAQHIEQGRLELAVAVLRPAAACCERVGSTIVELARLYAGLQLHARAQLWYECCVALQPHATDAWLGLARLHLDRGDADMALLIWNGLLDRYPRLEAALFYSAWALRYTSPAEAVCRLARLLQHAAPDSLYRRGGRELMKRMRQRCAAKAGRLA